MVTKHGVWVSTLWAREVVDHILKGLKIPDLTDTYRKGPRFR